MIKTIKEIEDAARDKLQARFDSDEFYCKECNGQGQLWANFLLSSAEDGEESERHFAWGASGFCCDHLDAKAQKAYTEAKSKIESARG